MLLACCFARSAYRLRAIRHLHEAENESQQWPALHAAIRPRDNGPPQDNLWVP